MYVSFLVSSIPEIWCLTFPIQGVIWDVKPAVHVAPCVLYSVTHDYDHAVFKLFTLLQRILKFVAKPWMTLCLNGSHSKFTDKDCSKMTIHSEERCVDFLK